MYDAIVLGAGVVGVNSAYWLSRLGYKTLVVDRQPAAAQETSFANGGQISVCHAEPWANPSAPLKVLRWLTQADAPLRFRPRLDPYQWRWLLAWLLQCSPAKSRHNTVEIVKLALYSRDCLQQVRQRHQLSYEHREQGILHFYRDSAQFEAAIPVARLMSEAGCLREILSADQALTIEPALQPIAQQLVGATYTPDDESGNAMLYTQALAEVAKSQGVDFMYNTKLERFSQNKQLVSIDLEKQGKRHRLTAPHIVVALGSFSAPLLRPIGINLNLYPAKGYSITIPLERPEDAPTTSLTDDQQKLVFSRLGDRLRIAGTAELSGYNSQIVDRHCESIKRQVQAIFPTIGGYDNATYWAGLRPATPSSVPYIGRTRFANLWLNTGHGTLGWTMGCGSGKLIADLIDGAKPELDTAVLALG